MMLAEILTANYGFSQPDVTPAPRGFVAETYYVTAQSKRYFVKIVTQPLDIIRVARSLPVLQVLHQHGMSGIPVPVPTLDGRLSISDGDSLLVVFTHVDGQWSFEFPMPPYVQLLVQLHAFSGSVDPPRETFSVGFKASLLALLERVWTEPFDNPHQQALQTWALERRASIARDLSILDETAAALQATHASFVLTHGDAPGNVLVDGDTIALVDWDEVLLAPRERDIWFHQHDSVFMQLYCAEVPDYELDRLACRYYLYYRYMDDLLGYIDRILSSEVADDAKANYIDDLVSDCDEWLTPLMDADRLA